MSAPFSLFLRIPAWCEGARFAIEGEQQAQSPTPGSYLEVRRVLQRHGFTWQQGSVYFGGESVTAVTCVLAAIDLTQSLPWFAASVRDIRMLRVEELNELMPAVQQASGQG